jgi:hypothetical protein
MGAREPRLVLAYVIVLLGAVALAGAIAGSLPALVLGAVFGWLTAILHSVSFFVRSRKRRDASDLAGSARTILAVTLIAMAASAGGNLLAVAVHSDRPRVTYADGGAAAVWAILVVVLCWRAWLVPSARRAAVLQAVAVWFAVPTMFTTVVDANRHGASDALLATSLFVAFVIVGVSGAALDKLFASVHDRGPDVVPKAILR